MSEARRRIRAYVLVTSGTKHSSLALQSRPGAETQMARIQRFAEITNCTVSSWMFDVARAPRRPASLATLFSSLREFKAEHQGALFIDDAARLFRGVASVSIMIEALRPYCEFVFDTSRCKRLSELNDAEWVSLLGGAGAHQIKPFHPRSGLSGNPDSLMEARRVSQLARAQKALKSARPLDALRTEMSANGTVPSHTAIAREANERGLRTSRGNEWSDVAVARALRRLDQPKGSSEAG